MGAGGRVPNQCSRAGSFVNPNKGNAMLYGLRQLNGHPVCSFGVVSKQLVDGVKFGPPGDVVYLFPFPGTLVDFVVFGDCVTAINREIVIAWQIAQPFRKSLAVSHQISALVFQHDCPCCQSAWHVAQIPCGDFTRVRERFGPLHYLDSTSTPLPEIGCRLGRRRGAVEAVTIIDDAAIRTILGGGGFIAQDRHKHLERVVVLQQKECGKERKKRRKKKKLREEQTSGGGVVNYHSLRFSSGKKKRKKDNEENKKQNGQLQSYTTYQTLRSCHFAHNRSLLESVCVAEDAFYRILLTVSIVVRIKVHVDLQNAMTSSI